MKKRLFSILALVAALAGGRLQAQAVAIPYEMSFELTEQQELGNWVLNPGVNAAACTDQWVIGNQLHSDGARGLYISNQGTDVTGYGNRPCVQFAYRDFILPDGNFYISFDYILPEGDGQLYVGINKHQGTTTQINNMVAVNNALGGAVLPNVGGNPVSLATSTTWATATCPVNQPLSYTAPSNGQPLQARLYFAWVSNAKDSVQGVAAAIDNIQITNANCVKPSNMELEVLNCDSILLRWNGTSVRYQAQYRKMGSNNWRTRTVRDGQTEVMFENLDEGNYDFRVRGICYETHPDGTVDTLYSPYAFLSNQNIFCPDRHCVNYIAIADTTVARCTYGKTNDNYFEEETRRSAYMNEGVMDFGWDAINSRHTVVWDTTAMDPRTGNQLRMVPAGEVAAVRLGNWETGQGAEAITYDFYVDPDNSILLLKYAIVLEDPDGHGADAMPRFVLQVFHEDGTPLDTLCGRVDLNPLDEDASWNHYNDPGAYGSIVWKDWSMMGLNLDQYAGQRLKVSVATYDCFWSAHYGYAYFTMGCASAHIKNTSCGAQQNVEVEAPEGFAYHWWNRVSPLTYDTRSITIGLNDPTDWICTLTSLENPDCSFDLFVNTEPRYPVADFNVKYEPQNCENRYVFENASFIRVNNNGTIKDYLDEDCDDYTWDFGFDGEESDLKNPGVIIFPEEGGDFTVTLTAMIGDGTGTCRDEKVVTLHVPALGEVIQHKDTAICEGQFVLFHGERYFESGQYVFGGPDPKTGCLNIDTLDLTVVENSSITLDTVAICYNQKYCVDGECYQSKEDGIFVQYLTNYLGCDSLILTPIKVLPVEDCCLNEAYQRWDDVLTIKKSDMQYRSFQWCKNDEPIPGANKSYYYEHGGLDTEAVYHCAVVLSDGSEEITCPIQPMAMGKAPIRVAPTTISEGETFEVSVPEDCQMTVHDVTGMMMGRYTLKAGNNIMNAPTHTGVYVVNIYLSDMQRPFHICVK